MEGFPMHVATKFVPSQAKLKSKAKIKLNSNPKAKPMQGHAHKTKTITATMPEKSMSIPRSYFASSHTAFEQPSELEGIPEPYDFSSQWKVGSLRSSRAFPSRTTFRAISKILTSQKI